MPRPADIVVELLWTAAEDTTQTLQLSVTRDKVRNVVVEEAVVHVFVLFAKPPVFYPIPEPQLLGCGWITFRSVE